MAQFYGAKTAPRIAAYLLANRQPSEAEIQATERAKLRIKQLHGDEIAFLEWMGGEVASRRAVDGYRLDDLWIQAVRDSASVLDFSVLATYLINLGSAEIPNAAIFLVGSWDGQIELHGEATTSWRTWRGERSFSVVGCDHNSVGKDTRNAPSICFLHRSEGWKSSRYGAELVWRNRDDVYLEIYAEFRTIHSQENGTH